MSYLDYLLPIFEHYSLLFYLSVFIFSFLESFAFLGIVVPGTTFVVLAGFLASQGFFHISALLFFSIIGAILGDSLGFYLGRHSKRLFKPDSRIFKLEYLEKGEKFTAKHGSYSVFLGRFIGPLRSVVPFVAGMFKMEAKKFIFYNISSAMLWSVAYIFLGYFFGRAWQAISIWSTRLGVTIFWIVIFLLALYILRWIFIKKGRIVVGFIISLIISIGEGIKDNDKIQAFFSRHPVLANFLKKRFDRTKFTGLMLTVLAALLIYAVSSFIGTALDVFVNGNAISADFSLANLLKTFRNPILVKIFLWITLLGKAQMAAVVMLAVTIIFWIRNKKEYILPFFVSVGGGIISGTVAKYIWQRPRPADVAVYIERSWSFPSGHAVLAVSLYGFLIYFLWKYFKKWRHKINALFVGFLVIISIGFSRLYLGVHYLSDVWAGYMVGFFWLIISIGLFEFKNKTSLNKINDKKNSNKLWTTAVLCLLAVIYVCYGLKYRPLISSNEEENAIRTVESAKVGEIFSSYKLAKFTETLLGNPQEPFSFIIVANNDEQLVESFNKVGWFLADSVNFNSLVQTFKFEVLNKAYSTAPITPYFWQSQTNDFGFEEPTEVNSARYRHHARFWKTGITTESGKNIYIGITSLDMGVKWWGITHKIKPDIDSEREYLFEKLNFAGVVDSFQKKQLVDPVLGQNFTGDQFFTDGDLYLIQVK